MSYEFYIIKRQRKTPREIPDILEWVHTEIDATDPKFYDDSKVLCRSLRNCYFDMLAAFPALNGRDRTDDDALVDTAVDYCLTRNAIEISCSWTQFNKMFPFVISLAHKYGLMIYYIDTFVLDSAPPKIMDRYCLDEFPSVWKAFIRELLDPCLGVFCLVVGSIMGLAFMTSYLYDLKALPYSVVFGIAVVIALIICSYLIVIGIRFRRKGVRLFREVERGN